MSTDQSRRDRLGENSAGDAGPMILILPGLSLMDVQPLTVGVVVVRCPGCGAAQVFAAAPTGEMTEAAFVHQNEQCPIRLRIEAAIAKARAFACAGWN